MKKQERPIEVLACQRGFSLIELLVATVLGLLLLEIVWQSYLSAKNLYRAQDGLAYLCENMRFAHFVLWQNIMQAGSLGCNNLSRINLKNHTDLNLGVRGYDSDHLPKYLLKSEVAKGTDVIVIGKTNYKATSILYDIKNKEESSFKVKDNPTTKGNHFLVISDGRNAELFETNNDEVPTVKPKSRLNNVYKHDNTEVRLFEEKVFFIKDHMNDKKRHLRSLYYCVNRSPKIYELVSDVFDMQISYAIGKDLGKYSKAKYIKSWDEVTSVRIDLKMQSNLLTKQETIYIKVRNRG